MKRKKENDKPPAFNYAKYSGMAIQMGAIIGLGIWGGVKLDELLALSFPIFTVLLSIVSVGVAIYHSIKDLLKK
ncbi:MAG: AtpZ/AtpI family protein [Bacteroidales bacterium]|nr:AtpZ/AtpI family protein [Bacteroidales bacterium]